MRRGTGKSSFPPNRGGIVVEYCRKYTVGRGVGRGSHPGYRPWSCGDRTGVLPAPAGSVVVSVGCTVFFKRGVVAFCGPCRPRSCIHMCASGSGARGGPRTPRAECWRVH